ncbi:hypothetical protein [Mycoplasma zalophidermidis]|uniref:Uncharacterized protein n=1 Tax=Mycoplasma zalophidermidis TaxID=398174 RepID=A0ABS6DS78_9MOLU|nr:hypothetical protein [Mycoplasma zalophidermidis]MBU4690069.1 hypothetical protein [Mycoplasma zalophidermidis]MBU4693865.1 hypothetical protein [Mycoplasma zalophidermidis]MCR8966828.1 hypothetical protein [Mycoplasma zalophidermidis]
MTITLLRRLLKKQPWVVITAFRLFDLNNSVINELAYQELKQQAIEALQNSSQLELFLKPFDDKKVTTSLKNIIKNGVSSFETSDPMQNVLNMMSVITGFTYNLLQIDNKFGPIDIDFVNNELIYAINSKKESLVFNADNNQKFNSKRNILMLEALEQSRYQEYLDSITRTTQVLMEIFGAFSDRHILTIVSDAVDTESSAEIDWTNEDFDLYGEVALIRKSHKKPKCHI